MIWSSYPILRLKPKTEARAIRHGFPWVYANQLVLDRRSRAIPKGNLAQLQDAGGELIALVAVNAESKIAARVLERDQTVPVDGAWVRDRLIRAAQMRDRLFDTPFYRLIHAEADGLPGVIIDRFGDTAVVQPNAAWADAMLNHFVDGLRDDLGIAHVIKNASGRARGLEGLDDQSDILLGTEPVAPIAVEMNGATYMADLMGGQKTGLFYDQRPNHAFAARLSRGARVLDVFSHVGGFSLAALAGGADHAMAVDGSDAALALAQDGAVAMGMLEKFDTLKGDAFEVMANLREGGELYDVVICDPPAFAPNKPALEKGLRAYERVARLGAGLVKQGGYLGLCSCSHAADLSKFRAASVRGIGKAGRAAQLVHTGYAGPDHPMHPPLAESGYLKALFFRL